MITRPDEYKHQNDNYAIVDNDNVRGGIFDLVTISNANLLTLPLDKRQLRTTITNGSDNKHYVYTGSTLDDTAWGTVGNWTVASGSGYTHPTGFTNQPSVALTGGNIISQITVNSNGHVTGVVSRLLTPGDIGAATTSHTHSNATTSVAGFMSGADKTKLDGITAGAETNQNAFSYVTVGATTLSATGDTDTLTLSAGTGITLTPDALTKSVVVSSTGSGTSAYGFGTVAVSGQTNVVADSVNDTLTLVAGTGAVILTNPTTDTITFGCSAYKYTLTATGYDIVIGSTTAEILSGITTALPADKNLKGNLFVIRFPQSTPTTLTSAIVLNGYYNGKIIVTSSNFDSKATVNLTNSSLLQLTNCTDLLVEVKQIKTTMTAGNFIVDYLSQVSAGGTRYPSIVIKDCYFTVNMSSNSLIRLPSNADKVVVSKCFFDNVNSDADPLYLLTYIAGYSVHVGGFTDIFISDNSILNGPITFVPARIDTGSQSIFAVGDLCQRITLLTSSGLGDSWATSGSTIILR